MLPRTRFKLHLRGVLLAAAVLISVGSSSEATAIPPEPLGHAGRWITDASGRVVVLHGVNIVSKLPPYDPASAGFGADDVALLAREGVNVVRVGVIYGAVEPEPGHYDDAYLDSIAATVRLLHEAGILSLLDFHQDAYSAVFNAEGFPAWAVVTDGLPVKPIGLFPEAYATDAALQRAYDNFWANRAGPGGIGLQDRYAAAWAHVAGRFRDMPGIVGYEIFNEPFPGSKWKECAVAAGCPELDVDVLTPFSKRVLTAIRTTNDRHMVWYEPWVLFDVGAATHHGKLDDPHIGMAFHGYPPKGDYRLPLDNAEQQSARTGDALLMTEFGAMTDPVAITEALNTIDLAMMSRIYWAYSNRAPYLIQGQGHGEVQGLVLNLSKPRTPGNVVEAKWDAFVRPYPQAVAGTPQQWSYESSTRTFALAYSTAPAGGGQPLSSALETEILVPARHYAGCYGVSATGARVVSRAGDQVLRLVNEPGATAVTVRVTPC